MATLGRHRQRKWREKQKGKKQVTILISIDSYETLQREKEKSGKNFFIFVDKAIRQVSTHVTGDRRGDNKLRLNKGDIETLPLDGDAAAVLQSFRKYLIKVKKDEDDLRQREEILRSVLDDSGDVIFRFNIRERRFEYVSPAAKRIWGYSPEEIDAMDPDAFERFLAGTHPDDRYLMPVDFEKIKKEKHRWKKLQQVEHRGRMMGKEYRWMSQTRRMIFDKDGDPLAIVGNLRDITKRKEAEELLKVVYDELEQKVIDRTASLEEANTALKVLLRKKDEDKLEVEEHILLSIKELIIPTLEKINKTKLDSIQTSLLGILASNLDDIISPSSQMLTSRYFNLTHSEIQVANLIIHGKTTKEIAEILNLSNRTIDFHRTKIRKKLGIQNNKTTLRSYLVALQYNTPIE